MTIFEFISDLQYVLVHEYKCYIFKMNLSIFHYFFANKNLTTN